MRSLLQRYRSPVSMNYRRSCLVCGNSVREGKPHCTNHIEEMPYVQQVINRIDELKLEKEGNKKANILLTDAVNVLAFHGGACTIPRLSKDLSISVEVAIDIASELVIKRKATSFKTKRGIEGVGLV